PPPAGHPSRGWVRSWTRSCCLVCLWGSLSVRPRAHRSESRRAVQPGTGKLGLEALSELLAGLCHLRRDHHLAVRLVRVPAVVLVVVVLGRVEHVEGGDLGHDRVVPEALRGELLDDLARRRLLLRR